MNGKTAKIHRLLINDPGKLWVYGVIPLFGFVALVCLLFADCAVFTPDQIGSRLFKEEQYEPAAERFADPLWQAAANYRNGNFKAAAAIYGGYDSATASFNHGNSLVMLGQYEAAVKRYERALELRPGWQAAEDNLQIAAIRAERVKQEGGAMTGGQLEPDEIVFTKGKPSASDAEEVVEETMGMSDAEMRAVWLRNVQTRPEDFLRSKFAYQQAMKAQTPEAEKQAD